MSTNLFIPTKWMIGFNIFFMSFVLFSCKTQNGNQSQLQSNISSDSNRIEIPEFSKTLIFGKMDSSGDLWFGTVGDGLYVYTVNGFKHYDVTSGLHNNSVWCMAESNDGVLWFGTDDGLSKYENGIFEHVPIPFSDTTGVWMEQVYPIINPNAVHSLMIDENDKLWLGTCGAGAYHYDGKTFDSYLTEVGIKMDDSLHHNWISCIIEDENGNVWFSSMSRGGAIRFDGTSFHQYLPKDGLFSDMVRTIFQDQSGRIWFGYKAQHDGGLTLFDGGLFKNYFKADGLCNHSIRNIFEDSRGHLWLSGDLNYLCIYNGSTFSKFISQEGDSYSEILFTLEDRSNNIWFGGKHGLWKFDGEKVLKMSQ
jgi:ligand-binding sensor domain-containing protein